MSKRNMWVSFIVSCALIIMTGCMDVPPSESVSEDVPSEPINVVEDDAFDSSFKELLLDKFGLAPQLVNVTLDDGQSFCATLILENRSGKTYTQEIEGRILNSNSRWKDKFLANWGGICITDQNTLAVITLDTVTLLDAHSLEEKPLPIDLTFLAENEYVVGIGCFDEKYIVVALTADDGPYHYSLLLFDSTGILTDTVTFGAGDIFTSDVFTLGNEPEFMYAQQLFLPTWEGKDYLVIPNLASVSQLSGSESGIPLFASRVDSGDTTVIMADLPTAQMAFLYEKDILTAAATLPCCNPGVFCAQGSGENEIQVQWGNKSVTVVNAEFDTSVSIDFTLGTALAEYNLDPAHLLTYNEEYPAPQSTDGRYRIVKSSPWHIDLSTCFNTWIHDTQTGQYHFLDVFTDSYGGGGDRGQFFDATQLYQMTLPGQLKVYDIVDGEPFLRCLLSDNAIAATYDAGRECYYVLELEGNDTVWLSVWSRSGEVVSRNVTTLPVTHHYEGLYSPNITVDGDTIYYESPHLEGCVQGTLNLTTFEFTEAP